MQIDDVRRVLMIGSGTMGTQVGWQFATHGYGVVLYDVSDRAFGDAAAALDRFGQEFTDRGLLGATEAREARARIGLENDAAKAA